MTDSLEALEELEGLLTGTLVDRSAKHLRAVKKNAQRFAEGANRRPLWKIELARQLAWKTRRQKSK